MRILDKIDDYLNESDKELLAKYRFKDSFKLTNKKARPLLKKKLIEPVPLRMGEYRLTDKGADLAES